MMASNFKVSVCLTKQPKDEPVFQKQDGQRFSACNTIKLNVNSTYTVKVVIRPQGALNGLLIEGQRAEVNQVKSDGDDEDSCKYKTTWSTLGIDQTKSGKRREVPIVLELSSGVSMKIVLQCKFYPEDETQHCHWGQPLHNIEYDCHIPEGSTFVDVTRTKYI